MHIFKSSVKNKNKDVKVVLIQFICLSFMFELKKFVLAKIKSYCINVAM